MQPSNLGKLNPYHQGGAGWHGKALLDCMGGVCRSIGTKKFVAVKAD